MSKEQYIEHCRALFENPLMKAIEHIAFTGTHIVRATIVPTKAVTEFEYQYFTSMIGVCDFDFSWKDSLVSRSDFEQGGKYYKKEL